MGEWKTYDAQSALIQLKVFEDGKEVSTVRY